MKDSQDISGYVFSVQRYSLHDGPGIRTLVFLKGCPLHCVWCANPEGLSVKKQVMYDKNKCLRCGACLAACPSGAVYEEGGFFPINQDVCDGHGDCVVACHYGSKSLSAKIMSVKEVVDLCLKDKAFYRNRVGGMTLGGGEPLLQGAFALAIIKMAKERGLHTAVETSACVKSEIYEEAVALCDIVYTDIKAIDDKLHQEITGVSNRQILDNIKSISTKAWSKKIVFRIPLIPGVNDQLGNVRAIGEFVLSLGGSNSMEVLPFHNFGESKYEKMNLKYTFAGGANMTERDAMPAVELLTAMGLTVRINTH